MQNTKSDRILLCISNGLILIACLNDLFIVKYRSDSHVVPRWTLLIVFATYLCLLFLSRILPQLSSQLCLFATSLLISICLSLSIFTPITNTISTSTNLILFDFLLLISTICSLVATFARSLNQNTFSFVHHNELAELIGLSCGFYITRQSSTLYYLISCLFLIIITLRLRAFHSFILLASNTIYFLSYFTPYSYIACLCVITRLLARPIIEIYFISLTSIERWLILLQLSRSYRKSFQRIMIILYFLLPFRSILNIGQTVRQHDEWFIIIPIFAISFVAWLVFRLLACSLLWMLSNKLIECYLTKLQSTVDNENQSISLVKLMASQGNLFIWFTSSFLYRFHILQPRYTIFWTDYMANSCLFDIIDLFYRAVTLRHMHQFLNNSISDNYSSWMFISGTGKTVNFDCGWIVYWLFSSCTSFRVSRDFLSKITRSDSFAVTTFSESSYDSVER